MNYAYDNELDYLINKERTSKPQAQAFMRGSAAYPLITGMVTLYTRRTDTLVVAEFVGLPKIAKTCSDRIFGLHIHTGSHCTGTAENPFADALGHYNPNNCPHPEHAGDLPPVFGNNGKAWQAFITNRFTVEEVLGHTVILHGSADDFTTQPAGNSGERIACGIIRPL